MRFIIGGINHETNAFSDIPADHQAFSDLFLLEGEAIIARNSGTRFAVCGVIDEARKLGITLAPTLFSYAMPSGKVARAEFDRQMARTIELIADAMAAGPIDGAVFVMHGAMVVEGIDDGEGEYFRRVRAVLGDAVPIGAVFDFHANLSDAIVDQVDILNGFDTYPHIDGYERAAEITGLLHRIVRRDVSITPGLRKVPMLLRPTEQYTGRGAMAELMARCAEIETRAGVLTATVAGGFPFADVADAGLSIYVATDGDPAQAQRCADELAAFAWTNRERFMAPPVPVDEAVHLAMSHPGPVLLADVADNTGVGTAGDGTAILESLIRQGARSAVVALIYDPAVVDQAIAAGIGAEIEVELGGKVDDLHGPTLRIRGHVRTITDGEFVNSGPMATGLAFSMGRTAVLEIGGPGGIEVICTDLRHPPNDSAALRSVGIDPSQRQIVMLKSSVHYRADFEKYVREIIEVDGPGLSAANWSNFAFRNLRRPIYPLDPAFDWAPDEKARAE